jgi:hypothetical protein
MKVVMVRIASWIAEKNLQDEIKILITMHDELVFEMPEDKLDIYVPQLYNIMCLTDILQGVFKWPVPLTLDAEYGDTWHVDHDLFKEKPHLKTVVAPIEFHQPTQVLETPAIEPVQSVPTLAQGMLPEQKPVSSTPEPVPVPVEAPALPEVKENSSVGTVEPEEIIYKVKDLTDVTLLKINTVLSMLTKECENKIYEGPIKSLKIYDRENNVLSVSNMKVRSDSFFILARLFGL